MDQAVCVPEEHRGGRGDVDGPVLEITDFDQNADMFFLAELYWQFYMDAVGEDLSGLKTFETEAGNAEMSEAEARLLAYLATGHQIKVAYLGNVMAGFLIYQPIFEKMIAVKCIFNEPWARSQKLAKRLINSLQQIPTHIIFKTMKGIPPKGLFGVTEGKRIQTSEDDYSQTWLMPWGK